MRDVSAKPHTMRTARAEAHLRCLPQTIAAIKSGNVPKADPLGVARVAGILGAKHTSTLIPYCHQVPLDSVSVEIGLKEDGIIVVSEVKAVWKTGVEIEALVAVSVAALTLYDMLKIIDTGMEIRSVRLIEKKGGKSDFKQADLQKVRAAVLVLSDQGAKGDREDQSGQLIKERLESQGVRVVEHKVLPDDVSAIEAELLRLCNQVAADLVLTSGGTGLGPRDVTPEATRRVIEREISGIEEALRAHGQERTPLAMLGRGVAGVRGRTVIVNLPGSVSAARESLDLLLPWVFHAVEMLKGGGHS
jgi:cyclic pyranopterin phosphate synthase